MRKTTRNGSQNSSGFKADINQHCQLLDVDFVSALYRSLFFFLTKFLTSGLYFAVRVGVRLKYAVLIRQNEPTGSGRVPLISECVKLFL